MCRLEESGIDLLADDQLYHMIHSHPNYILLNIIPTHPATGGIGRSGYNSLDIAMEMNWLF